MSNYKAIAALSKAIIELLRTNCPTTELANPRCELYHASNFENPMEEGFSLFLFRIAVSSSLRNIPPRKAPDGRSYRSSLPLDLHYLLTAWANDPERQQRLLGWAIRFLEDRVIHPANVINGFLGEYDKNTFRAEEMVEFTLDPLPISDQFLLWDKLKPKMQTSVTYVARMVLIDSDLEWIQAPVVQSREFRSGEQV